MTEKSSFHIGRTVLFLCAFALAGALSAGRSMAYFSTYALARGGYELRLGAQTQIREKIDHLDKHIQIQNTGEAACFVRVKVFSGSLVGITFSDASGSWSQGEDGYWYYAGVLLPGETAEELAASMQVTEEMSRLEEGSFDIIVIQECTPALWREDGAPCADWSRKGEEDAG